MKMNMNKEILLDAIRIANLEPNHDSDLVIITIAEYALEKLDLLHEAGEIMEKTEDVLMTVQVVVKRLEAELKATEIAAHWHAADSYFYENCAKNGRVPLTGEEPSAAWLDSDDDD
jgi:hypothetical protein